MSDQFWRSYRKKSIFFIFHFLKFLPYFEVSFRQINPCFCFCKSSTLIAKSKFKGSFLGPRGPLVLPLVNPPGRNANRDPLYTGIYASWIIRRLIKPTWWPHGAYPLTPWDTVGLPIDPLGPCRHNPCLDPWDPVGLPLAPLGLSRPIPWPPGTL